MDVAHNIATLPHNSLEIPVVSDLGEIQMGHANGGTECRWGRLISAISTLTWTVPHFHVDGNALFPKFLPFMVPSCGILCHMSCRQLTYPWPHSEIV